jgi:hypothetical protein
MSDWDKNMFDVWFSILSAIAATVAFLETIHRWKVSQHWRRSEQLDSFIEKFENDDLLKFTRHVLDWTARRVKYEEREITITNDDTLLALRDHQTLEVGCKFGGEQPLIRDGYDRFLSFCQRLEVAISSKFIDRGPAQDCFGYWLERFLTMDMHPDNDGVLIPSTPAKEARNYVKLYGSETSIRRLCQHFGIQF